MSSVSGSDEEVAFNKEEANNVVVATALHQQHADGLNNNITSGDNNNNNKEETPPEERRGVGGGGRSGAGGPVRSLSTEEGSEEGDRRRTKWVTYDYRRRRRGRQGGRRSTAPTSPSSRSASSFSSASSSAAASSSSPASSSSSSSSGSRPLSTSVGSSAHCGGSAAAVGLHQIISERLRRLLERTESCFDGGGGVAGAGAGGGRPSGGVVSRLCAFVAREKGSTARLPPPPPPPPPSALPLLRQSSLNVADVVPTVKNLRLLRVKLSKASVTAKVSAQVQTDEIRDCFLPPLSELKRKMEYHRKPISSLSLAPKRSAPRIVNAPVVRGLRGRKTSLLETRLEASLYPDTLKPFLSPKEAVAKTILQLENPEWEVVMQGLEGAVRLARHHPRHLQPSVHSASLLVGRHIRNLRSQVARAAAQASMHLLINLGRVMDPEVDDLCGCLLSRMADTNKFLRGDCMASLAAMVDTASPSKTIAALINKGAKHQNAVMRCATCRLFLQLATRLGPDRVLSLQREPRDGLLMSSAKFLTEGSLETRRCAKDLFTLLSDDPRLMTVMNEVIPNNTMRSIGKILNEIVTK